MNEKNKLLAVFLGFITLVIAVYYLGNEGLLNRNLNNLSQELILTNIKPIFDRFYEYPESSIFTLMSIGNEESEWLKIDSLGNIIFSDSLRVAYTTTSFDTICNDTANYYVYFNSVVYDACSDTFKGQYTYTPFYNNTGNLVYIIRSY